MPTTRYRADGSTYSGQPWAHHQHPLKHDPSAVPLGAQIMTQFEEVAAQIGAFTGETVTDVFNRATRELPHPLRYDSLLAVAQQWRQELQTRAEAPATTTPA